jgi:hypothetical protein
MSVTTHSITQRQRKCHRRPPDQMRRDPIPPPPPPTAALSLYLACVLTLSSVGPMEFTRDVITTKVENPLGPLPFSYPILHGMKTLETREDGVPSPPT